MPRYDRIPPSDPDVEHEGEVLEARAELCKSCKSPKTNSWWWPWAFEQDQHLINYMLLIIIILLVADLSFSVNTYLRSGRPREYKHRDLQSGPVSAPTFKSVQAAEYYRHHDHPHGGEGVHEAKMNCPVQHCEPVACESINITDQDAVKHVSSYTPALAVIEYYDADFDYDFSGTNKYRGPPTEEREKAWQELYYHQSVLIPTEAMPYLNRTNLEPYQKAKPEKGDGYLAWMEMHRQLGCLNVIREYTWFLAGAYSPERVPQEMRWPPEKNRHQVDHCIDTLRQSIMCYGDMTPFLVTKQRNPAGWMNDFNGHHTCRNFTKLQEWTVAHGAEDWGPEQGHHHIIAESWESPPLPHRV